MNIWLNITQLILALAAKLMGYLNKKQLIDAGENKERLRALQEAQDEIKRARVARKSVKHTPDELCKDPYNRDKNNL